jgi:hypothetical protein
MRMRIRIPVTSIAVPKVLTIVPEQTGELFSQSGLRKSGRRHGRSRPQNDVSSELIGVKQADALPNALGAFG